MTLIAFLGMVLWMLPACSDNNDDDDSNNGGNQPEQAVLSAFSAK